MSVCFYYGPAFLQRARVREEGGVLQLQERPSSEGLHGASEV